MADEITFHCLGPEEADMLDHVADGVFDGPVDRTLALAYLSGEAYLLAVAVLDGEVVAMASGVIYHHPDKPRELWVNEVGTADAHRRKGAGRGAMDCLLQTARSRACHEAWVLTSEANTTARAFYRSLGGQEERDIVMYSFDLALGPAKAFRV